jgi:hypothetical protein
MSNNCLKHVQQLYELANNCTFVQTSILSSEKFFYSNHSDFVTLFVKKETEEDIKSAL